MFSVFLCEQAPRVIPTIKRVWIIFRYGTIISGPGRTVGSMWSFLPAALRDHKRQLIPYILVAHTQGLAPSHQTKGHDGKVLASEHTGNKILLLVGSRCWLVDTGTFFLWSFLSCGQRTAVKRFYAKILVLLLLLAAVRGTNAVGTTGASHSCMYVVLQSLVAVRCASYIHLPAFG